MKTLNDENAIIKYFQDLSTEEIVLLGNIDKCKEVVEEILDKHKWNEWTNSSGKDNPPPDFYNANKKIMMEVMSVDDHEFQEKGKIKNPARAKEGEKIKEIINSLGNKIGEDTLVLTNVSTDLPTDEDHSYSKYLSCFERVINNHKTKIPLYKKNHPEYKLIFFIFDQSSMYFENENLVDKNSIKINQMFYGRIHNHCLDRHFVELIKSSGADYFIWFTPFKMYKKIDLTPREMYKAVVIDIKSNDYSKIELCDYNEKLMISSEV